MITADVKGQFASNIKRIGNFTVSNNPQLMLLLSRNLYSNPEAAPLRELATNAYDSHVAAGKSNTPFDVIIPSSSDEQFVIRDYGTGLSEEDLDTIYPCYGMSNRNQSNDFIGCMGLGSKSPFAITDSFSVESYFNGKIYRRIASLDVDNKPSIFALPTKDTNESNGLKIKFKVPKTQLTNFRAFASDVFGAFKVQPNINIHLNTLNKALPEIADNLYTRKIEGNFSRFSNAMYTKSTQLLLLMGNVTYNINKNQEDIKDALSPFSGLIVEVPIGSVTINASREELHYDTKTVNFLNQEFTTLENKFNKYLQSHNDSSKTFMQNARRINNVYSKINKYYDKSSIEIKDGITLKDINKDLDNAIFSHMSKNKIQVYHLSNHRRKQANHISLNDTLCVHSDKTKYIPTRCAAVCSQLNISRVLLLPKDFAKNVLSKSKYLVQKDFLDLDDVEPVKVARSSTNTSYNYSYIYKITHGSYYRNARHNFSMIDIDLNKWDGYFVEMSNFIPESFRYNSIRDIFELLKTLGLLDKVIFLSRDKEKKYARKHLKHFKDNITNEVYRYLKKHQTNLFQLAISTDLKMKMMSKIKSDDKIIKLIGSQYKCITRGELAAFYQRYGDIVCYPDVIEFLWRYLCNKYPPLNLIQHSHFHSDIEFEKIKPTVQDMITFYDKHNN